MTSSGTAGRGSTARGEGASGGTGQFGHLCAGGDVRPDRGSGEDHTTEGEGQAGEGTGDTSRRAHGTPVGRAVPAPAGPDPCGKAAWQHSVSGAPAGGLTD